MLEGELQHQPSSSLFHPLNESPAQGGTLWEHLGVWDVARWYLCNALNVSLPFPLLWKHKVSFFFHAGARPEKPSQPSCQQNVLTQHPLSNQNTSKKINQFAIHIPVDRKLVTRMSQGLHNGIAALPRLVVCLLSHNVHKISVLKTGGPHSYVNLNLS